MKVFLVTLSCPVIIDSGRCGTPESHTIYGFFAQYAENDQEQNAVTEDAINAYVSYLAAMHEWSIKAAKEFALTEERDWVDCHGKIHPDYDDWALDIQQECRTRLAIEYSLSLIDVPETGSNCLECGRDGGFITSKSLLEHLTQQAQKQKES